MAMSTEQAHCASRPDTLIVMLPGSYSRPEEFAQAGFVKAVRERRLATDLQLVDAHVGYYSDRSIIDRLQADVIEPARAQGYKHIWLLGISIGAFGAMILSEAHPQSITGIVALGPYLGKRGTSTEIEAQGGLRTWSAPVGPLGREEIDAIMWRWLQGYGAPDEPHGGSRPELYLGYGLDDRFRFSDELLAPVLPSDHVFTTEGGHDWVPWAALWQRVLDKLPLPVDDSCAI
jgi:pimeloyl-ACP methyl ester carboxylesterase